MSKSEVLYPKGSDGRCEEKGCREIAEYMTTRRLCRKHKDSAVDVMIYYLKIPHIIRDEHDVLKVRCLFCNNEWRPESFDLPKDDENYGRIPHKCYKLDCKQTILTMVGRRPRFDRLPVNTP